MTHEETLKIGKLFVEDQKLWKRKKYKREPEKN